MVDLKRCKENQRQSPFSGIESRPPAFKCKKCNRNASIKRTSLVKGNGLMNGNSLTKGKGTFRGRGLVNGNGLTNGNSIFKRKGLVNGNGLINGNGLTNGNSNFKKKGLVNGNGLINGNGLTNGNGIFGGRGLVNGNGIINGNGLTNGHAFERKFNRKDTGRRMVIVRVFVVAIILMIPWLLVNLRTMPSVDRDGIYIDGNLRDWKDVQGCIDAIDDQKVEPSVNIVNYRLFFEKDLNRKWDAKLSFYLEVEAYIFGNPKVINNKEPTSYAVHILIDSDNNPETGYDVRGIGADYMVEIEGHSGVVHISSLKEFEDSNQKNWNGFEEGNKIPSAIKDRALETQIYLDSTSVEKVDVLFHISDSNGNEDFSDTILSNEEGRLIVTQESIAPEVFGIGARDVEILRLTLEAQATDIEIESFNLTLVGTAQESDIRDISLVIEDRSEALDMDEGKIATATFSGDTATLKPSAPLKLANETSTSLFVSVSISPEAVRNRVMGLSIESRKDVVIKSGTVTLQSDIKMVYIGEIPEEVIIDGAFGEWNGIQAYKDIDELPMKNEDVDIDEYKIFSDSEAISLNFKVKGTMMGGTAIPMVPDYKEYVDIPVPNGEDNSASLDINEEVTPYLNEKIPKELLGEDLLYLFIDSDKNRYTGYCTDWLPVGAEHLIIISGKDGDVVEKVSLTFKGESSRDVSEVISQDLGILFATQTNNISWIRNNHANIDAISCSNQLEAKIERKLWGNKGSVIIFFIATNWNNRDIDGENLLSSIGSGVGGTRSELPELVTGIGNWTGDKFGWNVSYAGDINGDGYDDIIVGAPFGYAKGLNDIVTADNSDGTVTIYNGTSSGVWETKSTLDVGTIPRSVFVGDANNDGYNDILTADKGSDQVSLYNGTSNGGWEPVCTLSVGDQPYSVYVGDANNDGYNDILTADYTVYTVTIYNGTGSGGWEPKCTLDVGTSPYSVFVGDANNDGYNDILTADFGANTITIYNGTSSGGWEAKGTLSTGNKTVCVYVGDVNNDGYNDILTADYNDNNVTIYNGTSSGNWEPKGTLNVGTGPWCVFVGDANNDGYNDTLTADYGAHTVSLYNGTSGGSWDPLCTLSVGNFPRSVFVGDANNDGYNDILAADWDDDTVSIYNGTSSGGWEAKGSLGVGDGPYSVFVADANNDGSGANAGAVYIFFGYSGINMSNINAANANVTIYGSYAGDLFGWSVSDAGDVNGDGIDDVIIGAPGYSSNKGRAYVFYGRATGSWSGIDDADTDADVNLTGEFDGDRFGCSVSGAGDMNYDNYYYNWNYRKKITINASQVIDDLTNFPMLVHITDSELQSKARLDCYDIFFTSSNGKTKLDHEIESYNSSSGELVAWVKIPFLSSSTDTVVYMYYGSSEQDSPTENPTDVWDVNYVGVWHLNETGTGARYDSTQYDNNGIPEDYDGDEATTGKIDGADDFDGVDDLINATDDSSLESSNITVSFWFKRNGDQDNWAKILSKGDSGPAPWGSYKIEFNNSDETEIVWHLGFTDNSDSTISLMPINDNQWYYVVGTYDGIQRGYLDGVEPYSLSPGKDIKYDDVALGIGGAIGDSNVFNGTIDEVRISNVARSAEWIETEFNNQNDTGSFYYLSNEVPNGYNDVIIGAYGYGNDQGRAYIFYGPDFNVSGIPYYYAENLTVTELPVTSTWENYLTLTVMPAVTTNYLIIATSDIGPDGTSPAAGDMTSLRLRVNNTDTYHEIVKSFEDPTDWYHFSAVKYLTLLPGSHDIELEYKTDGDTGTFRNTRIIAIEMTIPSDQYDENESSVQSTSSEELAAEITFTPSSSGEYLIIASANVAHTDNKNSVWGRMYIDGTLYGETLMEPTVVTELMNFGVFKNITLDANPHTINLTVLSEDDPGDTSSMIHSHIAAIRVDTFLESHSSEAETQNAGSGAWETLVTNSYTPTTDGDFIILGTAEWFTNDATAIKGIRLNTSSSTRQESMVENRDATDKHMILQMDKRYLSGSQTDTMDHNVLATGWSRFARLITLPIGTTYITLTGEKANDKFGFSVSNAGRVNNDNFYDVIVGAPGGDNAYLFTGHDRMSHSIRSVDANVVLHGEPNTKFGFSVAGLGNIDNLYNDDVIVGAPGYNSSQGRAYLFYGLEYNDIVTADNLDDTVTILNWGSVKEWEGKESLGVGDTPFCVFIGDANNDGYNDILTADYNDNTVTIYNGTSGGGWEPVGKLYVGDNPRSVYVADTNNDSLNDIVTADYGGHTITIYNGTASGGWESNYTLSPGNNPYSVFVGDANNDGYNDILVTNYFNDRVSLYNGTSSGGWETKSTFNVGESPTHVFVGDANNDGYNDIVSANSVSDNITIYNGTSNGGWDPKLNMSVGGSPLKVFVGDANNDGYNDILTSDRDDNKISIYNGTSNGLWEAKGTLSVGSWPNSVFVGDANNDGYNDILSADITSDTVTIYNGTDGFTWEPKGTLGIGSNPNTVFVGDANNDGYNDIVTSESGSNTVTIIKSRSYTGWDGKYTLSVGSFPFSVFVGDANNDGYNDILTAENPTSTVTIYNGTSSGGWDTKVTLSVGSNPRSVFVADANNDGYNDILTADFGPDTVTIYNGTSSGGWEAKFTLNVGNDPYSLFVADANNDGYNDILTVDYSDDNVTIYNGTSSGIWEPKGTLSVGDGPTDLYVGDANNDGYNDIVTVDIIDYTVTILNGTGSGSWEPKFTLDVGKSPFSVFVGDANNDGYNDILTADQTDETVTIYNGTDNGWEGKYNLSVGDYPYSVFVADANNDGYNDILTADINDDTVTLYNGTASGDWEGKTTLSVGSSPTDVFVANADNDVMGGSMFACDADLILTGESAGDKFGYSVHYAGDIDGDGDPDVIVGAPYHTNGSATECGAMYVYCGGLDIDSTADYTNYGENAYDHFGWSVSYAGDINSDNYNDTLCGAPYYDDGLNTDAGKAYCHSTNIIPEFSDIVIPIFIMITIFGIFRRKHKKKHSKEIQNPKDNGVVSKTYLGGVQDKKE